MDLSQIVALIGGILGILAFIYVMARVGVRTDELWSDRHKHARMEIDLARVTERVQALYMFQLNRAEAEARVKHAITDREP